MEEFLRAEELINANKPKLPSDLLLQFYSFSRQALKGDNTTPEPSFYQIVEKAKWKAWMGLKGMSMEEAKEKFFALFKQTFPFFLFFYFSDVLRM